MIQPRLAAGLLAAVLLVPVLAPAPASAEHGVVITGAVTAGGAPLPGAEVTAVAAEGGLRKSTSSADDGTWSLVVASGAWYVHVADPAGAWAEEWIADDATPTDIVAAVEETTTVVADLEAAAQINGRVVDPSGAPVPGAQVSRQRPLLPVRPVIADGTGRFELPGLRRVRYEIEVAPPEGAGLRATTASLEAGPVDGLPVDVPLLADPVRVARLAGPDRIATSVAVSRDGWADGSATVVIAAAGSFPDALAAAPLAVSLGAPLLLVSARTAPAVLDEVERLGATDAVVIGAVGAVGLVVSDELSRAGVAVRRIAGDGRFDTAALVAREVGAPQREAFVASGGRFADALAAGPVAAALGAPVLLTDGAALAPDTAAVLEELGVERTFVLGGTAAISDAVVAQLPDAQRIAGADRYATSAAIARFGVERGLAADEVAVATGRTFPDALAAGPWAGRVRGVLLLADDAAAEAAEGFLGERTVAGITAMGGESAVSEALLQRLAEAAR